MKTFTLSVFLAILSAAVLSVSAVSAETGKGEAVRITKEELRALIGQPGITIIDVRSERDWRNSGTKITGAVHEDPVEEETWAGKYARDARLVLYCA